MATKKPFVLVSTEYGTMIVNRLDYRALAGGGIVVSAMGF